MTRGAALVAVARTEVRRRWVGLVAVGVVAGLVGGVAIAAVAGTRRSASAYDRLVEETSFPDLAMMLFEPPTGAAEYVAGRPEVAAVVTSRYAVGARIGADVDTFLPVVYGGALPFEPLIVEGRAADPDAVEEVILSERFARQIGVRVGERIPWHGLSHRQFTSFGAGFDRFEGPLVDLEVVGITKLPSDATLSELPAMFGTAAFGRAHGAALPDLHTLWVDLADAADTAFLAERVQAFLADADADDSVPAGGGAASAIPPFFLIDLAGARSALDDGARFATVGLGALIAVVAIAGGFVVAEMIARHLQGRRDDDGTLRSLGLRRRDRVTASVLSGLSTVPVAGVVAVALAAVLSSLFPVGATRSVEPHPGFDPNVALIATGAVVVATGVTLLWALLARRAAWRADGLPATPTRPVPVAPVLSALSWELPSWIGSRMAFEPGTGRSAVPVRLALAGTAGGFAGMLGILGFGASLDALVGEPARWGQPADVSVELTDDIRDETLARIEASHAVEALTIVTSTAIDIGGTQTTAYGVEPRKGELLPTVVTGRLPSGVHEIALGPALLARLHRDVGDDVLLSGPEGSGGDPVVLTIVGAVLTPGLYQDTYTTGAAVVPAAIPNIGPGGGGVAAHLRFAPGVSGAMVTGLLGDAERSTPEAPVEIDNLAALDRLPGLSAVFLAALSVASMAHAVVVAGRRRRPDLAVLRTLGFTRPQTRRAVVTMAVTVTVAGVLIGAPVGVVLANLSWSWVATYLFVSPELRFPVLAALVPLIAVAAAVAFALVPANVAARTRPAHLLRRD